MEMKNDLERETERNSKNSCFSAARNMFVALIFLVFYMICCMILTQEH